MTRVYDCFLLNAELDLLEFRLDLLADVVDVHVIVEAPRTFSGAPKPLHLADNLDRFTRHADRIRHIVVDDMPMPDQGPDGRWVSEHFQRRALDRGLGDAAPDDVVILSDVDEIPDPEVLRSLLTLDLPVPVSLDMTMSYQRANWTSATRWVLPKVARFGAVDDLQALRLAKPVLIAAEAGCHLSYLMDDEQIVVKLRSYSHDEFDTPLYTELDFIRLCTESAIFPLTGEPLTVRGPRELDAVQQALLAVRPDLFAFEVTGRRRRGLARRYVRSRHVVSLPARPRRLVDSAVLRAVRSHGTA